MKRRVTVTGAAGYVGSVLVGQLLEAGYHVRALDRFFFGADPLLMFGSHPRLNVRIQDIRSLAPSDLEGEWAVIDLAALSNDPSSDLDPKLTWEINQIGRMGVAKAAKAAGVERYIFSSSCSVYGAGCGTDLTEDSPLNPLTAYAKSCAAAETHVLDLDGRGFRSTALRLATVFGLSTRMRFDLVVNLMTLDAYRTGKITVLGGNQWRPLVSVHDVARAFCTALQRSGDIVGGKAFNIGLTNMQISDIAISVKETIPKVAEIITQSNSVDRRDYNVNFDRARTVLGFTPKRTIPESILEIYDALEQGKVAADERTRTVAWYAHLLKQGQLAAGLHAWPSPAAAEWLKSGVTVEDKSVSAA